jgi:predicted dehydrogenase
VVVVATSNDVHVALATAALDLGKAVVVDKPLAPTADDAARLVEHARVRDAVLGVFHNRRWDSDTLTAADLLASGELGTVHRLESRFTRFRPQVVDRWRERPGGGGVLLDLGTHLVDQAVHLLGPVAQVWADVRVLRSGAEVDDDAVLSLTHASGAGSLLWCSAAAPWTGPRLVLQGSRAGWVKQDLDGQESARREGRSPGASRTAPCGTPTGQARRQPAGGLGRVLPRLRRVGPHRGAAAGAARGRRARAARPRGRHPLGRRALGRARHAVLTADTSNSSVTLSLMSTPPVSSAAL